MPAAPLGRPFYSGGRSTLAFDSTPYITVCRYAKPVLAPSGVQCSYDELAVDSPFVFFHGGEWHMMHIGFDGIGYQTAIAHGSDLVHWSGEEPLFRREDLSGWDRGGIAGVWILRENSLTGLPTLKKWHGRYWMVYHSYPDKGYEAGPASIGLAWCEDEDLKTWIRLEEPILTWCDGACWEHGGLYKGCLVEENGRFLLFYNAKDRDIWPWHEQIGLAVSDDLVHWTRHPGNPVIVNHPGGFDSSFAADPCVVKDGDTWLMFHYVYDGVHAQEALAWSDDLLHWHCLDSPLLRHGGPGSLDEIHAHKPSVVYKNGILYHFYCAVRPSRPSDNALNQDPTRAGEAVSEYRCITVATSKPLEA